jgi:branched-chain amino acid transport system substrate-binding protein
VAFTEAFEAVNDYQPDQFAAQAYTGTWLIATAIRCGDSTDKAAVRDALAQISAFNTPLGVFSFDENGEPVHEPIAQVVQNGAFVPLATAMMEAGG